MFFSSSGDRQSFFLIVLYYILFYGAMQYFSGKIAVSDQRLQKPFFYAIIR